MCTKGGWLRGGPQQWHAGVHDSPSLTPHQPRGRHLRRRGPRTRPPSPFCSGQREPEVRLGLCVRGGLGSVLQASQILSPGWGWVGSSHFSVLGLGFPEAASCLGEPWGSLNINRHSGEQGVSPGCDGQRWPSPGGQGTAADSPCLLPTQAPPEPGVPGGGPRRLVSSAAPEQRLTRLPSFRPWASRAH